MKLVPFRDCAQEWLHEAKTMVLYGASYTGKSVLAAQMGLAIALGEGIVLGHAVHHGAREVLLVMGENDEVELRDILRRQVDGGEMPPTLRYCDALAQSRRYALATTEGMAWLRRVIVANGSQAVFLDNLMSLVGDDLKRSEVAVVVMEGLKRISKELGTSFVVLGHTRKPGADGDRASGAHQLYGAHEWLSYADAAVRVDFESGRDSSRRMVTTEKVRGIAAPGPIVIGLDEETWTAHKVADAGRKPKAKKTTPRQALEAVRNRGQVVTVHELGEALGVGRSTVYRIVGSPEFEGWEKDGTIDVTATGNRGKPSAWRFIGPMPPDIEVSE